MWFFRSKKQPMAQRPPLRFYNTLAGEAQEFTLPKNASQVRMYNCGPTVYDTSHIGNLRSYVFADLLRRTLEYNGYKVKQVINITDFGHLSSDADSGPDKMTKALKREGMEITMKNMRVLAERYTEQFVRDLKALNIDTERIQFPRASDHVAGEIALIQTLEEKGFTYPGTDGLYYDTSQFPDYGKLGDIDLKGLKEGARIAASEDKRHPTDFLLWKADEKMGWDSPWGKGFPGWHIECSSMIRKTLGEQIDIHTGGIDLMPTHHNNEIAQSEAATGKRPLSRFWMHHEFLNLADAKISKSAGNMINLSALTEKGFHPLTYRYFLLGAHYKTPINFSWEALEAAQTAFLRLRKLVGSAPTGGTPPEKPLQRFRERINDDLDTPGALAALWEGTKHFEYEAADMRALMEEADNVLGLNLTGDDALAGKLQAKLAGTEVVLDSLPQDVRELVKKREAARKERRWSDADALREELSTKGYEIKDGPVGPVVIQKK